jgi:hypothetical protein
MNEGPLGIGIGSACIAMVLAGCVSTREVSLAPDTVRIDTQAQNIMFAGQALPQTLRAAARATLARGYTHFKFADAGAAASTFGTFMVTGSPSTNSATAVIMFHADDPQAKDAFDAAEVLKQYRW